MVDRTWTIEEANEVVSKMYQDFPNITYREAAQRLNKHFNTTWWDNERVRDRKRKLGGYKPPEATNEGYKQTVEYNNGCYTFTKIIELIEGEDVTPDMMIKAHGLKVGLWEIVGYKNNFWQAQKKGGQKIILYQSKLSVKPSKQVFDFEEIEEYFKNKDFSSEKPNVKPLQYDPNGEVLEICLPDLHSGLLAWNKETGADYDLKIVKERFQQCALDIVSRCSGRSFKKIILVTLGDLLHVDNEEQKTTKGTFQQTDGRLSKIFTTTLDMLIDFIDTIVSIAPTEIVYVAGNHDRVAGLMLLKAVEKAYRKDKSVVFDTSPNPHKFRLFGKCLVGWTHGDLAKKNMPHWLQHQAKQEYGQSEFAEVHAGHFHSIETIATKLNIVEEKEVGGILVRHLPTLCNASYWEHQQAYTSVSKTMMCFIWNENTGLRDVWYSNIV